MKIKELLTGDKNKKLGIYILLFLGIVLFAFGSVPKKETVEVMAETVEEKSDYFEELEKRLSHILSSIDGAGRVEVMLVGDNSGSLSVEKDENKTVVLNGQGGSEALIKEENYPSVRGAVIIAEGAGDDKVRLKLADASSKALGIGMHRVGVYKMK